MRYVEDIAVGNSLDANLYISSIDVTEIHDDTIHVNVHCGSSINSLIAYIFKDGELLYEDIINGTPQSTPEQIFKLTSQGLLPGTKYYFQIKPYQLTNAGGSYGNSKGLFVTTTKPAVAATVQSYDPTSTAAALNKLVYGYTMTDAEKQLLGLSPASSVSSSTVDPATTQSAIAKSVYQAQDTVSIFQLSNPNKGRTKFITAEKSFSKLDTSRSYFAFGTNMYMKAASDSLLNSGGIMIFSSNNGQTGYYISIQSADSADVYKQNAFRILKIKGGSVSQITDSQQATAGKFASIYNGEAYKIDVLVKKTLNTVEIIAYINGFKITAVDYDPDKDVTIAPTKAMSLVCAEGTVYFDYVYSNNIDPVDYAKQSIYNNLGGKFSKAILNSAFGEKILENNTNQSSNASIEEFGTSARELRYYNIKYTSAPGYPSYATAGANSLISVLGQKLTSFGAELYVLNNSSMFASLSDGDVNNLWVIGKNVIRTGQIEYLDDEAGKYSTPEPVIFESTWIQKNSDAVALANWVKNSWSKKQQIITMSVIANPLISVGDVVTIKYPYINLDGTQKFIVTNVNHTYGSGLETTITCRTL